MQLIHQVNKYFQIKSIVLTTSDAAQSNDVAECGMVNH